MLRILENQVYDLETELQEKNKKMKELHREIIELKNRNLKLHEQVTKKTR